MTRDASHWLKNNLGIDSSALLGDHNEEQRDLSVENPLRQATKELARSPDEPA